MYLINVDGTEVISLKTGKAVPLNIFTQMYDYAVVNLSHQNKHYTYLVHQLVMMTYGTPKPYGHYVITHLDGNKKNNHINNLKWILRTNVKNYPDSSVEAIGIDDGDIIKFRNISIAAKYFHSNVTVLRSKIANNQTYKGYSFKYLNKENA